VAVLDADPNKGAHRWATQTYGGGRLGVRHRTDARFTLGGVDREYYAA